MDTAEKFLESISLDTEGLARQFMSLSSFFNILLASVTGFLILLVYLASSDREHRDKNLYMVIPLLCVLMAVIMRIDGPRAISFFGIFGIMSVIRFRSDITDQKGITFILFAVIEGVIVGVNAYLLALLAWLVVSGAILIGRYLFGHRRSYRLTLRYPGSPPAESREEVIAWFESRGISAAFSGFDVASEYSGKRESWKERCRADYMLFPKTETALLALVPELLDEMRKRRIEAELKRLRPE